MSGPIQSHRIPFSLHGSHWFILSLIPCPPPIVISLIISSCVVYSSTLNIEAAGSPETMMSTKLHSTTFQKTAVLNATAMGTSNLT